MNGPLNITNPMELGKDNMEQILKQLQFALQQSKMAAEERRVIVKQFDDFSLALKQHDAIINILTEALLKKCDDDESNHYTDRIQEAKTNIYIASLPRTTILGFTINNKDIGEVDVAIDEKEGVTFAWTICHPNSPLFKEFHGKYYNGENSKTLLRTIEDDVVSRMRELKSEGKYKGFGK